MKPIEIIRYKNRKLYDKETGYYTSVNELVKNYVMKQIPFQILEHKTGRDETLKSLAYAVKDVLIRQGKKAESEAFLREHLKSSETSNVPTQG